MKGITAIQRQVAMLQRLVAYRQGKPPVAAWRPSVANEITSLHEMGYLTAGGIAERLGICTMTIAYIIGDLGIPPSFEFAHRPGSYWSPEDIEKIRQALIAKLEAAAPPSEQRP